MAYNYESQMRDELEKLSYRQDMRRAAKEINEEGPGSSMIGEIAAGTIAHWAEMILQEFFGSSNYGYTIKTTGNSIILKGMYRDAPVLMDSIQYEYTSEVGFAESPNIKEYKGRAADWMADHAVEIAAEARQKILSYEEQQAMR